MFNYIYEVAYFICGVASSILAVLFMYSFYKHTKIVIKNYHKAIYIHGFNKKLLIVATILIILVIMFINYKIYSGLPLGRSMLSMSLVINGFLFWLLSINSFIITDSGIMTLFRKIDYIDISEYTINTKRLEVVKKNGNMFIANLKKGEIEYIRIALDSME